MVLSLATFWPRVVWRELTRDKKKEDDWTRLLATTDLRGKVAVVTGSNTGIGKETAFCLARLGAEVVIACRDSRKGQECVADLTARLAQLAESEFPYARRGKLVHVSLDLSSLAKVAAFAEEIASRYSFLNILVNNGELHDPKLRT